MGFAGILENLENAEGGWLESFSILTTSANSLVAQLHDRMPVILYSDEYDLWINRNMHNHEQLTHLYLPYPLIS
jgi:putative SOS response-associated peptidase YedK